MAVAVVLSLLFSLNTAFGPAYEDWRSTTAVLSEKAGENDLILLSPPWSEMAFDYYYQGEAPYEVTDLLQAQGALDRLLEAEHVWLVVNRHPSITAHTQDTETWFLHTGRLINTYQFPRYLTIYQLEFYAP